MTRQCLIWIGALALVACRAPAPTGPQRIVSLSPSFTETLFAIGAGDRVVGVTDFCDDPPEAKQRTRIGSMLQPNYEAIARLRPTLLVGEQVRSAPIDRLQAIAPVQVLPWLTLSEVVASTRELGKLVDREAAAQALAGRIETRLQAQLSPNAPRVLLAIAGPPGRFSEVWFVKRNSLHGRVLEASGGRNAVDDDVTGAPTLSLERLISVDPDIVIVLVAADHVDAEYEKETLDAWKALPTLKAVKNGRVKLLVGLDVQSVGPRILKLTDRLAATLREMGPRP
jgi:ABC-type Fe3+-hydroxamate transport system substrate-binding protein